MLDSMTAPTTVTIPAHGGHDPDDMNESRAEWGEAMIQAIMDCTGTDRDDALSDGLADLMHWAKSEGLDFAKELDRACGQFKDETAKEGGWDRPIKSDQFDLDASLERWQVHEPGMWENDTGPEGWTAVSNDDGIVAYFGDTSDAFRHRLAMVNRDLNP